MEVKEREGVNERGLREVGVKRIGSKGEGRAK